MNEKQKLAVVRPDEIAVMRTQNDLAHPYVEIQTDGTGRADADELRLWRHTRRAGVMYACGTCGKPIKTGCYCSQRCVEVANGEDELCEGCPPVGYPTDATRCTPCPRRSQADTEVKP